MQVQLLIFFQFNILNVGNLKKQTFINRIFLAGWLFNSKLHELHSSERFVRVGSRNLTIAQKKTAGVNWYKRNVEKIQSRCFKRCVRQVNCMCRPRLAKFNKSCSQKKHFNCFISLVQRKMILNGTICLPEVFGQIRKTKCETRTILQHDNASSQISARTRIFDRIDGSSAVQS